MSRFLGEKNYKHGAAENIGVLLANLGTPSAPTAAAVRKYLKQFLSDPRVIEMPQWRWQIILRTVVLPFRSPRSAAAYRQVWTDEGSPLLVNCEKQRAKLAAEFSGLPVKVELGMSYGEPSIPSALRKLKAQNCRRLFALPLYPQYAGSTTGSVFGDVAAELSRWRAAPHFRFAGGYADEPGYIAALAESVSTHWKAHGRPAQLIFSFHGTPQQMLLDGDPYHCMCHKTARLTAEKLNLREEEWQTTFQSRFGRGEWLRPPTDETMRELPRRGIRNVQVICPGFSADCLETLEEIAEENRGYFMEAGGEKFSYIPALNDSPAHIAFLRDFIRGNIADWLSRLQTQNAPDNRQLQKRLQEQLQSAASSREESQND